MLPSTAHRGEEKLINCRVNLDGWQASHNSEKERDRPTKITEADHQGFGA